MRDSLSVIKNANTVLIKLPQECDLNVRKKFIEAYINNKKDICYKLDFRRVKVVDSAFLGMLFLLSDHTCGNKKFVQIVNANHAISDILKVVNYNNLFSIV